MWYQHETVLVNIPNPSTLEITTNPVTGFQPTTEHTPMQTQSGSQKQLSNQGSPQKWATFDLDWTLIRPVDALYAFRASQFEWLPWRREMLLHLVGQGRSLTGTAKSSVYRWAIFTNQHLLTETGKVIKGRSLESIQQRIQGVIDSAVAVGLPEPYVFVALGEDQYRKPNTGMWQLFTHLVGPIALQESFYCGDATGTQSWSDVDLRFAEAIGLPFKTPEQVFPSIYEVIETKSGILTTPYLTQYFPQGLPNQQELWIFVGAPGAGKTEFYHRFLQPREWVHVNRDTLKTKPRMMKTAQQALQQGRSVSIDNTNPTRADRQEWIRLAQQYRVPVKILYFVRDAHTQNKFRTPEQKVPDVAYHTFFKRLEEPERQEGVTEIVRIW